MRHRMGWITRWKLGGPNLYHQASMGGGWIKWLC